MNKRTKATSITQKTKRIVWERDNHCCIFCGRPQPLSNANMHYISRANGGLGIPENIGTGCLPCHNKLDQSTERKTMLELFKQYLSLHYPNITDEERKYKK